jgi:uncharacterized membrane protein YedE/YeeE
MEIESLVGGVFIGLATSALLVASGELFGVSGVLGGLLSRAVSGARWRIALLAGLVAGGFALRAISPSLFDTSHVRSNAALIGAGLLVGFGSRLANGCTSGHGVAGIARFSLRSFVATLLFIVSGIATVRVLGGWGGAS